MPSASRQPSVNAASVDDYRYANQSEPANRFRLNNEQQRRDPYPTQRYRTPHPMASGYRGYDNRDRYPMLVDGYEGFEHHREIRPSPVCYSCGVPGHIARFCDRRRAFREEPVIIENVDEWTKKVLETEERHTKRIKLNEEAPAADTHLFHLWEARRSGKLEETEAKQAAQEKNRPPH
ncbi:hypothetical protein HPB50_001007 [Hyalomma asiaticum]|uniref:Uncharacterized protein n=1 Tax=Hyalomma asiaticum TaxID=266040 RepID=A0ACB7SIX0_HYAAI|nr:hypothetical protein HPB50_001007 [Hyalomma asiaticum]